jgi:hypothetical protein
MAMSGRIYERTPARCLRVVAPSFGAGTSMAPQTAHKTSWSFRNDHVIGRPTGTGADPTG